MDANELADEIMEHYKAELPRGFNVNWMQEAATMLRQQQIAIEALKTFYEDRLEASRKREETLMKTVEALLKKAQEK